MVGIFNILPGSRILPVLPTSPLRQPSETHSYLNLLIQLLCSGPDSAGVYPFLVRGHLLLAEMNVGGCLCYEVVDQLKAQVVA